MKTVASSVPTALSPDNGDTITNPYDINTTFNFYFASIPQTTKKVYTQYSHKDFPDYLANENGNTIQYKIIQYNISMQLADLFNFSFITGVFPLVFKTVTPCY